MEIGKDLICGDKQNKEHTLRGFMTNYMNIGSLSPTSLRVIEMNCQFKIGGGLSKQSATSFVVHMSMSRGPVTGIVV